MRAIYSDQMNGDDYTEEGREMPEIPQSRIKLVRAERHIVVCDAEVCMYVSEYRMEEKDGEEKLTLVASNVYPSLQEGVARATRATSVARLEPIPATLLLRLLLLRNVPELGHRARILLRRGRRKPRRRVRDEPAAVRRRRTGEPRRWHVRPTPLWHRGRRGRVSNWLTGLGRATRLTKLRERPTRM